MQNFTLLAMNICCAPPGGTPEGHCVFLFLCRGTLSHRKGMCDVTLITYQLVHNLHTASQVLNSRAFFTEVLKKK